MTHFEIVQVPYYLQMLRAALFGVVALLIARQVAHHGITGVQRRGMFIAAELLCIFDAVFAFGAFGAVGISAGQEPVIPRDEVLLAIRILFTASAACGITAQVLLMLSMARLEHQPSGERTRQ